LVSFFNSNWYLHKKYYDAKKIKIQLKQLPHVIKTDKNQIYSYVLLLENNYPTHIKIKNISANLNSRMPFIDYDILLSDRDKGSIHVDLKDKSNILLTTPELRGGDILCLTLRCSPMLGNMPKHMTLSLQNIPIKFNYELFQVPHEITPKWGMRSFEIAARQYNQQDIIFEKTIALDHRQVFDKEIEYQYGQYSIDNGSRHVSILCSSDKFIKIKYNGLHSSFNYKSKYKVRPDCKKIDIIRIMVFRNDSFLLEESIGMEKTQVDCD